MFSYLTTLGVPETQHLYRYMGAGRDPVGLTKLQMAYQIGKQILKKHNKWIAKLKRQIDEELGVSVGAVAVVVDANGKEPIVEDDTKEEEMEEEEDSDADDPVVEEATATSTATTVKGMATAHATSSGKGSASSRIATPDSTVAVNSYGGV